MLISALFFNNFANLKRSQRVKRINKNKSRSVLFLPASSHHEGFQFQFKMCLRHTNKDQGYAWVIVILAFFCNTITLGPLWTVGIWTTKFELAFGQSKFYTSLVGSGLNAVYYVTGKKVLCDGIICKVMDQFLKTWVLEVQFSL